MIDETYRMMDAKYELSVRSTNIRILTSFVQNYLARIAMGVARNLFRACARRRRLLGQTDLTPISDQSGASLLGQLIIQCVDRSKSPVRSKLS